MAGMLLYNILFSIILILIVPYLVIGPEVAEGIGKRIPCPPRRGGLQTKGEPIKPGPFDSLTVYELKNLYAYLSKNEHLNIAPPNKLALNASFIYLVDLFMPPKAQVLEFLQGQSPQPAREAHIIVFRGDKRPPVVEEYQVGPLPNPRYVKLIQMANRRNPVPFALRPISYVEIKGLLKYIVMDKLEKKAGFILKESYGTSFTNCSNRCLTMGITNVGTSLLGSEKRYHWWTVAYNTKYYSRHPVDFIILVNQDSVDPSEWTIDRVVYAGLTYASLEDLIARYKSLTDRIPKTRVSFPEEYDVRISSTNVPKQPPESIQRPPMQMEPDGKRYTVKYNEVSYFGWKLNFLMSTFHGPQLFNVRFNGERIAYEVALCELSTYYAGSSEKMKYSTFTDSNFFLIESTLNAPLVPEVDCPEGATSLDFSFLADGSAKPWTTKRSSCVFEKNLQVPFRRHFSYAGDRFFTGIMDTALVVRSVLILGNYDYIIDFVFRPSGTFETEVHLTGSLIGSFYPSKETKYGWRVEDNFVANIHHHSFHFKVDLDVKGVANRYETLDVNREVTPLEPILKRSATQIEQIYFTRNLKRSEQESVYHYDFNKPKYHIFYNNDVSNRFGNPKAFRIDTYSTTPQLLHPNVGINTAGSIPWTFQQLVVTVQNDDERTSSSLYSNYDSLNPVNNFTNFFADNQRIVDQDLVVWMTIGTYHIPHTEDLPMTSTTSSHLSFAIRPYNYFPECESSKSTDNIQMVYQAANRNEGTLHLQRYGKKENGYCGIPSLESLVKQKPADFVDI